jgi:hypothetical protein
MPTSSPRPLPPCRPRPWTTALCTSIALLMGACASPAPVTPEGMVPTAIEVARQHPHGVSLVVMGGADAPLPVEAARWNVANADLAGALADAIVTHKVFSSVTTTPPDAGGTAEYRLAVAFVGGELAPAGEGFTAKAELAWSLETIDGKWIWRESVQTWGSAQAGDSDDSGERRRLATARALRENIAQSLSRISKLGL